MEIFSATTTVFSRDLVFDTTGNPPLATPIITTPVSSTTASPSSSSFASPIASEIPEPDTTPTSSSMSSSISRSSTTVSTPLRPTLSPNTLSRTSSFISISGSSITQRLSTSSPSTPSSPTETNGQATNIPQNHDHDHETALKQALTYAGAGIGLLILLLAVVYLSRRHYKRRQAERDADELGARPFIATPRVTDQVDPGPSAHVTRKYINSLEDSIERLKRGSSRPRGALHAGTSNEAGSKRAVEANAEPVVHVQVLEIVDEPDVYGHPPEYRWSEQDSVLQDNNGN